jgi:hypothetical protein
MIVQNLKMRDDLGGELNDGTHTNTYVRTAGRLMVYSAMSYFGYTPTFRRNVLTPSSGLKSCRHVYLKWCIVTVCDRKQFQLLGCWSLCDDSVHYEQNANVLNLKTRS